MHTNKAQTDMKVGRQRARYKASEKKNDRNHSLAERTLKGALSTVSLVHDKCKRGHHTTTVGAPLMARWRG